MRRTVRSATITRSRRPSSISSSCLRPPPVRSAPAWSAEVLAEASSRSCSEAKGASSPPEDAGAMTEPGASSRSCRNGDLPASLGYEFRDARRFAEWGVDYVKVDWCHTDGMGPRAIYANSAMALRATGRPIVLSICEWGRARPWEWAGELGHLWRTSWDI